jgi:cell wall-associated NlpC family hydrolase
MIDNELYVKRARELLGSPYKHLGRTRRGIDCFGVMFYVYDVSENDYDEVEIARKMFGVYFSESRWRPDRQNPTHTEGMKLLSSGLNRHLTKINSRNKMLQAPRKALPGDLMLIAFKSNTPDLGDHVAIYMGKDKMIHSDFNRGVVEIDITPKIWRRCRGVFRKE